MTTKIFYNNLLKRNCFYNNHNIFDTCNIFKALKLGQKRVAEAREYLNKLTDGKAMPALALTDNKSKIWEAVGEENLYAFVDESAGFVLTDNSGYILALVDKSGSSKNDCSRSYKTAKRKFGKNL